MNNPDRERRSETREERKKILKALGEIAVLIALIGAILWLIGTVGVSGAKAEEAYRAYVICQPGDYVNARINPSTRSNSIGRYESGDSFWTDGKKRNGFLHVVNATLESSEAWIYAGYVCYETPQYINQKATVVSNGRLAARKTIDGKVRCWLKNGNEVTVYWMTDDWCVTNRGFIRTQYLETNGG